MKRLYGLGIVGLVATGAALAAMLLSRPALPEQTGAIAGTVAIRAGGSAKSDRAGVVVYLEGIEAAPRALTAQIRQRDQVFIPDLTVVTLGSTIDFPNDDKVFHNVFSVSDPAKFDLGLYKSGESKSVQFGKPGVVDVYCNIHPQMAAKIKVLGTPYYAVTGSNGSFVIPNVPPGTYPIVGWQSYGDEYHGTATVRPGQRTDISFELTEGDRARRHLRKDGQPYGRYK